MENYVYLTKRQLVHRNLEATIEIEAVKNAPDAYAVMKSGNQFDVVVLRIRTATMLGHINYRDGDCGTRPRNILNCLLGAITLKPIILLLRESRYVQKAALEVANNTHIILVGAMIRWPSSKTTFVKFLQLLYESAFVKLFNARMRAISPNYIVLTENNIFSSDYHLNALGHAILSERLAQIILELNGLRPFAAEQEPHQGLDWNTIN